MYYIPPCFTSCNRTARMVHKLGYLCLSPVPVLYLSFCMSALATLYCLPRHIVLPAVIITMDTQFTPAVLLLMRMSGGDACQVVTYVFNQLDLLVCRPADVLVTAVHYQLLCWFIFFSKLYWLSKRESGPGFQSISSVCESSRYKICQHKWMIYHKCCNPGFVLEKMLFINVTDSSTR